jgi:hypothetical protein
VPCNYLDGGARAALRTTAMAPWSTPNKTRVESVVKWDAAARMLRVHSRAITQQQQRGPHALAGGAGGAGGDEVQAARMGVSLATSGSWLSSGLTGPGACLLWAVVVGIRGDFGI